MLLLTSNCYCISEQVGEKLILESFSLYKMSGNMDVSMDLEDIIFVNYQSALCLNSGLSNDKPHSTLQTVVEFILFCKFNKTFKLTL